MDNIMTDFSFLGIFYIIELVASPLASFSQGLCFQKGKKGIKN